MNRPEAVETASVQRDTPSSPERCDCTAKVNAYLAERNTVLSETTLVNRKTGALRQSLIIKTERLSRQQGRTKVHTILPSFCPFCGERYKPEPVDEPSESEERTTDE